MFVIEEKRALGENLPGFILGFSFSTETGSVALRLPNALVVEVVLQRHQTHAVQALPTVQHLLEKYQLQPQHCLAVAADVGPGGFTGLRTACALAQGLAIAWNVPCYVRSSLELMAWQVAQSLCLDGHYLAYLDARQNEVYAAIYAWQGGGFSTVQGPKTYSVGFEIQSTQLCAVVGNIENLLFIDNSSVRTITKLCLVPSASSLVQWCGLNKQQENTVSPENCLPLYVRHQVAKTILERQQVGGLQ